MRMIRMMRTIRNIRMTRRSAWMNRQVEGQDGREVHQGQRRQGEAQPAAEGAAIRRLLHAGPDPQHVLHREDRHGEILEPEEASRHQIVDLLHRFQDHGHDVQQDQGHDEEVEGPVEPAGRFRGTQEMIGPSPQSEVRHVRCAGRCFHDDRSNQKLLLCSGHPCPGLVGSVPIPASLRATIVLFPCSGGNDNRQAGAKSGS